VASAIDTLENSLANPAGFHEVQQTLGFEYPDDTERQQLTTQLHHRLLGLLYGVLTAAEFPEQQQLNGQELSPSLLTALNACGKHWDAAWWYPLEDSYNDIRNHRHASGNGVTGSGRVDAVMNRVADQKDLQGKWWMHPATWLTVRRLLMFLPDPVGFGITVFDGDLQRSVEIAGRLAWPNLRDNAGSIRISPALLPENPSTGSLNPLLSGDSAGGLLGCGLCTLTHGEKITTGLTASVALRLKDGRKLTPSDTQIRIDDIHCAGVGGALPKLGAAEAAGLKGVALHSENKTDADSFRSSSPARKCMPEITSTFGQLHRFLTRGFQIDQLVAGDAQAMLAHWTRARKGEPLEGERHHLDVFVKPRVSVRVEQSVSAQGRTEEKWETLPAGVKSLLDLHFIPSDQWLVITEDAGGGKTVLSWLLAAALSRHAGRFWVVRYEGRFPEDLRKDLEQRLQSRLRVAGLTQTAREVLDDLLAQGRVVVIYDALDQDNSSTAVDRIHALRHSNPDDCLRNGLRLIVTSRPYAVNQHHTSVFQLADWRHFRLELFDARQQTDYRAQLQRLAESRKAGDGVRVQSAYGQLLPDPDAVADLLAYPVVQSQLRSIIESQLGSNGTRTLRPFRNAGDLYWEVANRLLDRAFKSRRYADTLSIRAKLLQLLACYGYLMMLKYRDYRVPQMEIETIHASMRDRCNVSENDWKDYEEILQDTAVTERLLLKENVKRELSFPSLKMAEFFAGLYLGRYCDERVVHELQPQIGMGEWNNIWRFVAELSETSDGDGHSVCQPNGLRHSLQALFAVPDMGKLRPTESMFRAWQVLTRNAWLSEVREQVLTGWRQPFRRILIEGYERGYPSLRARTAAEVVFEGDLEAFVESALDSELARLRLRLDELDAINRPDRQQKAELQTLMARYARLDELSDKLNIEQWCQQLRPSFENYALCSDAKKGAPEQLTFMMGASAAVTADDEGSETPWQNFTVPAFYMATARVTRAQYQLFDPQREQEHIDSPERAPEPDRPMIWGKFHDGMCFALWLDDRYSLPSEVQWEIAKGGGLNREQLPEGRWPVHHRNVTSAEVIFLGNYHLLELEQRFPPNSFGQRQMNGHVWQYTPSEVRQTLQDATVHEKGDLSSGSAEAHPCIGWGSWVCDARFSRCSLPFRYNDLWGYTGIRLSRTK
jgi:hypothetical protein